MAAENGERVTIKLYGPVSPTFGSALQRKGILAGDFDMELKLRYNSNGTCSVWVDDANPYLSAILSRDTNAVVYLDSVAIYSGHIEEQVVPLVPGDAIEFLIVDAWQMFLGGALAWPNPVPAAFAESRRTSGNVLAKRATPWTSGKLKPQDAFDLGQIGLGDREVVYSAGASPLYTWTSDNASENSLRFYPAFQRGLEPALPAESWETGYWNPRWRKYPASLPLSDLWHTEASWVQELIRENIVERMGYTNLHVGAQMTSIGKYVWYAGTVEEDMPASAPESWRYGPLLRFDVIEDAVEEFLDGVEGNGIRARIVWDSVNVRWALTIDEPTDLSTRVLSVEGGEIVGGSATLSGTPVSEVVAASSGDGPDRALDGARDVSRPIIYGWKREVFENASSVSPVWENPDGSFTVADSYRIEKYHHLNTNLNADIRAAFAASLKRAGLDRLEDGRAQDSVAPKLQESDWFRYTPGVNSGSDVGYDLGTRVAIRVPGVGVLYERVRGIDIDLSADGGLEIVPTVGDPTDRSDLSRPLARTARATSRIQRN